MAEAELALAGSAVPSWLTRRGKQIQCAGSMHGESCGRRTIGLSRPSWDGRQRLCSEPSSTPCRLVPFLGRLGRVVLGWRLLAAYAVAAQLAQCRHVQIANKQSHQHLRFATVRGSGTGCGRLGRGGRPVVVGSSRLVVSCMTWDSRMQWSIARVTPPKLTSFTRTYQTW